MRSKKILIYGLAVSLAGVLLFVRSTQPGKSGLPNSLAGSTQKIAKVVDGDTVELTDGLKKITVRLIGVDTPEVVDPRKPVQCFGREASNFSKSQLKPGTLVNLESDPSQGTTDKYGRTLGYIILADGTNFNKKLIEAGYAHEYTYQSNPYKYQKDFKAAEVLAQNQAVGLWSAATCAGDTKKPA